MKQINSVKTALQTRLDLTQDIIPAMLKAPSAHNTQPWRFVLQNDRLDVLPDWNRHLMVSDRTTRQIYVSLGCAIANGIAAAGHFGFKAGLSYFPDGIGEERAAARLTFEQERNGADTVSLLDAIDRRRSDRSFYDGLPLTSLEKGALTIAANPNVFLIEDKTRLQDMAEVTRQATFRTLSRPEFRAELSSWVRNNLTRQPDGMPGYAVGLPTPISFIMPTLIRLAPIHWQEAPKSKKQVLSSSAVAIIATPDDSPAGWMQAGQLMETLWLQAVAAGLSVMPIIASVEAGNDTRNRLQQICGTTNYPHSVLRFGHSHRTNLKASPRRRLEDCLVIKS